LNAASRRHHNKGRTEKGKQAMKVLQISKQGLPTEVMELVDISEPDALKARGLVAAVEYAPITSIYGEW
jgi:hypothetical protein